MKELRLVCQIVGVLLLASPSLAFSFSFADEANTNGERGQTLFFFANVGGSGVDMTLTARDLTDGVGTTEAGLPNPYFDEDFNGLPGGLGVCQGSDPACEGSPDDNLGLGAGLGEVLILSLSSPVSLNEISFRNGIHELDFAGSTGINVGAGNPTTAETFSHIFTASAILNPNLAGTRFSFVSDESFVAGSLGDPSRLYIESMKFVPEPGTGVLVAAGLAALTQRRRRAVA